MTKILNLVYKDKTEIPYEVSKFPDGQQNITIDVNVNVKEEVIISSRLNTWLDLEIICCSVASLRASGVKEISLNTPYILGARSDRKFEFGGNQYLSKVLAPIINSLNFKAVYVTDPHSYVLENVINNCVPRSNASFVDWAMKEIASKDFVLIAPDAGASHKIYKVAKTLDLQQNIIICSKERDKEGNLTKVKVPVYDIDNTIDCIIIDDICDGGATFINIAKELKDSTKRTGKIYLLVTHGIFSKSTTELSHYFDHIYCTNSYRELDAVEGQIVKSFNIF